MTSMKMMKLTPTPIKEIEFLQKNKSPRLKQFCCIILTNIKTKQNNYLLNLFQKVKENTFQLI